MDENPYQSPVLPLQERVPGRRRKLIGGAIEVAGLLYAGCSAWINASENGVPEAEADFAYLTVPLLALLCGLVVMLWGDDAYRRHALKSQAGTPGSH
jgi:hypothetical protein